MSDTETKGPWTVLVFRYPFVNPDTPQGQEEREALQTVGSQVVVWYDQTQR